MIYSKFALISIVVYCFLNLIINTLYFQKSFDKGDEWFVKVINVLFLLISIITTSLIIKNPKTLEQPLISIKLYLILVVMVYGVLLCIIFVKWKKFLYLPFYYFQVFSLTNTLFVNYIANHVYIHCINLLIAFVFLISTFFLFRNFKRSNNKLSPFNYVVQLLIIILFTFDFASFLFYNLFHI